MRIDLNADVGEGAPDDGALLDLVTSASVACGQHAGDPSLMRRTVDLCVERGVAIGAHPGYPDRAGFGRGDAALPPAQVHDLVLYQIGALRGFAVSRSVRLQHVKPHGALYNQAARDPALADAITAALADHGGHLVLYGPAGSELDRAAERNRLPFVAEVFADRGYRDDGSLVPRAEPGAFVTDPQQASARVLEMVTNRRVRAISGAWIPVRADTVCVHGDNPEAAAFARALRLALGGAGVTFAPPRDWL